MTTGVAGWLALDTPECYTFVAPQTVYSARLLTESVVP